MDKAFKVYKLLKHNLILLNKIHFLDLSKILDLFMPPRHEIVPHYGTQNLGPLHKFLDLFLKHHSGCSKNKQMLNKT